MEKPAAAEAEQVLTKDSTVMEALPAETMGAEPAHYSFRNDQYISIEWTEDLSEPSACIVGSVSALNDLAVRVGTDLSRWTGT